MRQSREGLGRVAYQELEGVWRKRRRGGEGDKKTRGSGAEGWVGGLGDR